MTVRKLSIRDTVESTSYDPNLSGYIEIECDIRGVRLRWDGEQEWIKWDWYELFIIGGGTPTKFREVLNENIEKCREDAIKELILDHTSALAEAYQKGFDEGIEHGKKIVQLKVKPNKKPGA